MENENTGNNPGFVWAVIDSGTLHLYGQIEHEVATYNWLGQPLRIKNACILDAEYMHWIDRSCRPIDIVVIPSCIRVPTGTEAANYQRDYKRLMAHVVNR